MSVHVTPSSDGYLKANYAQEFDKNGWMRISVDSIRRLLPSGDENVKALQR